MRSNFDKGMNKLSKAIRKTTDKVGMTEPNAITLKCNESGIIGTVVSHEESSDAVTPITEISKNTTKIRLIGHSSDYYLRDDRNLSSLDPNALAKSINSMYKGNKDNLEYLELVSCEVGLVINGRSFAQEFLKAMQGLGFEKLKVRAFNPPELDTPATGMIVSTSRNNTEVDVWVYRRKSHERKDKKISLELNKLNETIKKGATPELIQQRNSLLDEQSKLRLYICERTKIDEALALPQNTFKGPEQKAKETMTLDVALAITSLKYQRMKISKQNNQDLCDYLDNCLTELQKNPKLKKQGILDLLAYQTPSTALDLSPYTQVIQDMNAFIEENRVLPQEVSITNSSKNAWQFIKSFFEIFAYTYFKGAAPEEFKNRLDIVEQNLRNSMAQPNAPELKQKAQNSFNDLKEFLLTQIQEYLDNNENPQDEMHINKRAVMKELKNILNEPKLEVAKEKLSKLNSQITNDRYKFWNKGLASKVAATKLEIEEYIEQKSQFKPR